MKISVIVPIYNVEKYLPECIESILGQSFTDWELILVNDGSPDNCDKICKEYEKQDNRIQYFYQKNAGVSAARNLGMKHATGDYIFFMDSDDTISPNFLENAYNTAILNDSDIVVLGNWFKRLLPKPPALPMWATFIKHDFINKFSDLMFPIGIQPGEDGLFSHQLLALTSRISFIGNVQYIYRQHDASNHLVINSKTEKVLSQISEWLDILTNFYNKYDLWNTQALHLAKFIEHEPFEFRYIDMPFNAQQHKILFDIIHNFYDTHIKNTLSQKDFETLTPEFKKFITSKSSRQFDLYYRWHKLIHKIKFNQKHGD